VSEVLTVAEVAEWLRCSRTYVRNAAEGRVDGPHLQGFRVGRLWRFRREAVQRFIERREAEAA
jgi:excisionase family DNA binding protein